MLLRAGAGLIGPALKVEVEVLSRRRRIGPPAFQWKWQARPAVASSTHGALGAVSAVPPIAFHALRRIGRDGVR